MYFNALNKTVRHVIRIFSRFLENIREKAMNSITRAESENSLKHQEVYSYANSVINLHVFSVLSRGINEGSGKVTAPITNYIANARKVMSGEYRLPHNLQ